MKAFPEVDQEAVPAGGIHMGNLKKCVTGGVGDCKQEPVHSRDRGGRKEAEPGEELGGGGAGSRRRGKVGGRGHQPPLIAVRSGARVVASEPALA